MITKPSDLRFNDKKLAVIIAGVPGIGKTTTALSSPKPLLIDLDKGISRVEARFRTDTEVVNNFEELKSDLEKADLSNYETIVIDTGGKLLEMLKPVVIAEETKNGKKDGTLSLAGYGAVKRKFRDFINFVKSLDKHLVLIFHATEVTLANDLIGLRIRIEGSSKDDVWDDIDIGGFMEMNGNKRTIGFKNCERYYAKGTHGIHGIYEIPQLTKTSKNDFLTKLFTKIQEDLNNEVIEYENYKKAMTLKDNIKTCKNAEEINAIYENIKSATHYLTSKEELWFALNEKATELGLKYDKSKNIFE